MEWHFRCLKPWVRLGCKKNNSYIRHNYPENFHIRERVCLCVDVISYWSIQRKITVANKTLKWLTKSSVLLWQTEVQYYQNCKDNALCIFSEHHLFEKSSSCLSLEMNRNPVGSRLNILITYFLANNSLQACYVDTFFEVFLVKRYLLTKHPLWQCICY